jgi:hypothetical protein
MSMQEAIIARAQLDIEYLLDDNSDEILKAMMASQKAAESDKKFQYAISIGVRLRPRGRECDVTTTVAWGVKYRALTEATVSDGRQGVLEFEEARPYIVAAGRQAVKETNEEEADVEAELCESDGES